MRVLRFGRALIFSRIPKSPKYLHRAKNMVSVVGICSIAWISISDLSTHN